MKKPALCLLATFSSLGTLVLIPSCSDSAKKLRYEVPLYSGPVYITIPPSTDTTNSDNLLSAPNYIDIDSVIRAKTNNSLSSINITNVRHISTKLTLLNGTDSNNFANFKSCCVSFYSISNDYPYIVSVPNNPGVVAYSMDFPVDANDELKSYLTGSTFYYSVGGKLRKAIPSPVRCRIETQFNITVEN